MYYTSVEDLNLFYEVADAPFGLYWSTPAPVMFDEPFRLRTTGQSIGQRFPFTAPTPGAPSNQTLSFDIYEPFTYYPGYNIHNRLPYAEHFKLSIQRELTKATVLTVAYVGLGASPDRREPAPVLFVPATPLKIDVSAGGGGCGFFTENDVFRARPSTLRYGESDASSGCQYGRGVDFLPLLPRVHLPGLLWLNNTGTLQPIPSCNSADQPGAQG
jgi:hypothetical protein